MGCDGYANDDGVFEIEIRDYESMTQPRFDPKIIRVEGLRPRHKIAIEVVLGDER